MDKIVLNVKSDKGECEFHCSSTNRIAQILYMYWLRVGLADHYNYSKIETITGDVLSREATVEECGLYSGQVLVISY